MKINNQGSKLGSLWKNGQPRFKSERSQTHGWDRPLSEPNLSNMG